MQQEDFFGVKVFTELTANHWVRKGAFSAACQSVVTCECPEDYIINNDYAFEDMLKYVCRKKAAIVCDLSKVSLQQKYVYDWILRKSYGPA